MTSLLFPEIRGSGEPSGGKPRLPLQAVLPRRLCFCGRPETEQAQKAEGMKSSVPQQARIMDLKKM